METFCDHKVADNPYWTLLALLITSSSFEKDEIQTTGPMVQSVHFIILEVKFKLEITLEGRSGRVTKPLPKS